MPLLHWNWRLGLSRVLPKNPHPMNSFQANCFNTLNRSVRPPQQSVIPFVLSLSLSYFFFCSIFPSHLLFNFLFLSTTISLLLPIVSTSIWFTSFLRVLILENYEKTPVYVNFWVQFFYEKHATKVKTQKLLHGGCVRRRELSFVHYHGQYNFILVCLLWQYYGIWWTLVKREKSKVWNLSFGKISFK